MDFFKGLFQVVLGLAIIIGAGAAGIAWVAACFSTVIIGILLPLFAPSILLFPFGLAVYGIAYVDSGFRYMTGNG